MKQSNRNNSVSIVKGLAIILVVAGHSYTDSALESFVLMFHVAAFFCMAGYCFKDSSLTINPKEYILKKIRALYVPYVKYSLIFLALHNLFFKLNIYNDYGVGYQGRKSVLYTYSDIFSRALKITTGMHGHDELLGMFWFIPELLFGTLIFYLMYKYITKEKYLNYLPITTLLISICLKIIGFHVPHIGVGATSFLAASLMSVGYIAKKNTVISEIKVACIFLFFLLIANHLYPISMNDYVWYNEPLYFCYALLGTYCLWVVADQISKTDSILKKGLIYIGNNTMVIFTFHMLSFKIVNLFLIYIYNEPIQLLASFPTIRNYSGKGFWIIYTIVGITSPLLFDTLKNKLKWENIQH